MENPSPSSGNAYSVRRAWCLGGDHCPQSPWPLASCPFESAVDCAFERILSCSRLSVLVRALLGFNYLEPPCTDPYARWCGRRRQRCRRPYAGRSTHSPTNRLFVQSLPSEEILQSELHDSRSSTRRDLTELGARDARVGVAELETICNVESLRTKFHLLPFVELKLS